MRHLARHLALAACLATTGSVAHASPDRHVAKSHKKAKHRAKVTPAVDPPAASDGDRSDDDAASTDRHEAVAHKARHKTARPHDEDESDGVAFVAPDPVDEARSDPMDAPELDAPRLHAHAAPGNNDWHVAIGPNVWASSVDAKVSVGSKSVSTGIDFFQLGRHARYGIPLIGEARYGRLSFVGDFTYGVIDVAGSKEVGPLMASLDGAASSLMFDGFAGYRVVGDEHSVFSLEARAGLRYQRTTVAGSLEVDGSHVVSASSVDAGSDVLGGARVFVRPFDRLYASGTVDVGLFGSSASTWSAGVDANWRVSKHVLVSAGWRTLSMDRSYVQLVMHGPRAALEVLF